MIVKPFRALRPQDKYVKECAALPYDVMSSEEAREEVVGKPYSFLHIDKAEIDLDPSTHLYADEVYAKAAENLRTFEDQGIYVQEKQKKYYFYRQIMDGRAQTGIVGCASVDDYLENRIKKHELTRAEKELDRIKHVDACSAQTGPIFLVYKESTTLDAIIAQAIQKEPLYDFISDDGIRHTIWASETQDNEIIEKAFQNLDVLYIADGHHRAASAVIVGKKRREENLNYNGTEDFNFFLSVVFPAHDLKIMDYNRILYTIGDLSQEAFIHEIEMHLGRVIPVEGICKPKKCHTLGMYLGGQWYEIEFNADICTNTSPSKRLDCAILQNEFLAPVLGIKNPRVDKRIDFVGGIRGLKYLEERCKTDAVCAFAMFPTSMDELMSVADIGEIMPPKSTWFEPKLRSGIFIHKI